VSYFSSRKREREATDSQSGADLQSVSHWFKYSRSFYCLSTSYKNSLGAASERVTSYLPDNSGILRGDRTLGLKKQFPSSRYFAEVLRRLPTESSDEQAAALTPAQLAEEIRAGQPRPAGPEVDADVA
jgi:hypothetical protein